MTEDNGVLAQQIREASEEQPSLPEAGGSATTRVQGPSGVEIMLTARSFHPYDAYKRLLETVRLLVNEGFTPAGGKPIGPTQTETHPEDTDLPPNDGFVNIEEFAVSMNEGKMYFKIKGGPFKKWGITVWPEVLVEAFGQEWVDNINPMKPPKITGRAYYIKNERDQPDKVVSIRQ